MPYTLNGIGTHYYGAGNRSARVGVCQSCKRSATLSSYDTREWFCVLFIPLIPLTRYRILDGCSSCRRHHRIKATDFAQQVERSIKPLRDAIQRSPREPQPHIELIRTLVGWQMRSEAQREIESALAMFPQNVELLLLSAEMAVDRTELERALPLYERVHAIDPQNGVATYGLAWLLTEMQRYEQAVSLLQQAVAQDANRVGSLYLLGTSQMKLSRWHEALNAFQQLLSLEPKYAADKKLMRLVRECKEKLGYELNDAERRAGRNWWPFGKKAKRATLQEMPVLVRPALKYAGFAILAIVAVSLVFTGWDRKTNIEMYFDNALNRPVQIDLDGRRFDLARMSPHKEEMKQGAHTVIVREAGGKEIERMTFRLVELPVYELMHDRFYVYNVAAQRVYRRAVHGYASRHDNATYSEELVAMQRFFEQRDVDYPFRRAPETISMDANATVERKISFNPASDITLSHYALVRLRQGKSDEAKSAIDRAAANAPCDTPTRRTQVYVSKALVSPQAAADVAHRWIMDCAQDDLEAHRTYQDVNKERGLSQDLRGEYRKLVDASPDSGKAHYLYGRVLPDPAAAAAEFQRAMKLDPQLVWARVALAHAYTSLERHADALREYAGALDMHGVDPSIVTLYASAAVANGSAADAAVKVDKILESAPNQYLTLHARWLLAVASSDWTTATRMQKALAPMEGDESAWWRKTRLQRMEGDAELEKTIDLAMNKPDLRAVAATARIEHLIDKGEYANCAGLLAEHAEDLDPSWAALLQAYAAGGLLMRGQNAAAMKILDGAQKALDGTSRTRETRVAAAVIAGLRGSMPVSEIMELGRDNDALAHAWFVAAVRASVTGNRGRAVECLSHSMRAASDLEFPYLAARSMKSMLTADPHA